MTVVIGLTGSIASGKSTVSQMFSRFNIPVVDADRLSRKVVEPGESAYNKIVEAFGFQILQDDRTIDRKRLGKIIFSDEEKRQQLNSIVHPQVRQEMLEEREAYKAEGYPAVVLDIPLLFESRLTSYVDRVMVVYVDEETQLNRLMERDQSEREEAEERIQAQLSVTEKAKMADAVIDNNGSVEESFQQLKDILHQWNIV
ncbi:dephospho-CoA kinase [Halobacillus halophilus]|uniref:Dephospho-CoA kinase n=1 Tax=Halobacillus halophilus (strain ATCC 35676 / DSM 2266 / JCM 20832 / KCTC 3685 / LMG 17431 / NBRC 102448 / NCIMB 2269) TaxID=866895 RepID=I0JPM5_HALH3|nr:dephospho-CoA kinase [Halobacillus halophilus]ASF40126.1 dephospho-CoA kinase [Halobacillus halophilus]CCG46095.1 dephospho-CoA kinase [Halobacillus halophilus DSM 2266]